jgi:capsular exopolysaccharide synthesis family protein
VSSQERLERTREGGSSLLAVLRRRWAIVVAIPLACVFIAALRHELAAKSYSATATVAFRSGTVSEAGLGVAQAGSAEPQREANTEVLTAHSPEVARGVAQQLHITAAPSELLNEVSVESAPTADVLNITASTRSAQNSARLANAFAEQYIAFRTRSELSGIESAEAKISAQIAALPADSPERATLSQSLQRLNALRAVAGGGANVIGPASRPVGPSGKGLASTAAISLLIGLALAMLVVFGLESLDRRVKTVDEFEHEYGLPALAAIPQSPLGSARAEHRKELLEPHRILRSALDFAAVTRELDTLLVTSASAGEGKTTLAVDLAQAIALAGRKVALVELDLRHPTFAAQFGVNVPEGLTLALTRRSKVEDMLTQPLPDLPELSVLFSGPLPPNPSELLGSPRIAEMIDELARQHDVVIVDAPPLNPVADAQVLLDNPSIHGVLLVARAGKTTRDEVRRAKAILDRHLVEPVGLVVTGLRDAARYGYRSYGSARRAGAPDGEIVPGSPGKPDRSPRATPASTPVTSVQQL